MTCAEFASQFDAWAAGTLSDAASCDVERHAASCEACGARLEAASRLGTLPAEIAPPPALRAATLQSVRRQRVIRRWQRAAQGAVAIAAMVVVAVVLQPRRKSASDFPGAGRELVAREHAQAEFSELDRAERELSAALRDQPQDARLAAALTRVQRQRDALQQLINQASQ